MVLALIVPAVGCIPRSSQAVSGVQSGQVATAFKGDLSTSISASGQVLARQHALLSWAVTGRVAQVLVEAGDRVQAGDILVQLETDQLERSVQSIEQTFAIQEANLAALQKQPDQTEVAAAQAAVVSAKAQLDDLLLGPSQEDLARAQAAMASAAAQLDDLAAGPSKEDLAQAESALASALATISAAEAQYSVAQDQLVVAQNDVDNAKRATEVARWPYDALVLNNWKIAVSWGPYSPQAAALKQAQIDYQVALARYNLTRISVNDSGYLSAQVQLAQARANLAALTREKTVEIASARAQLAQAKANLSALTREKTAQIAAARAQLAQAEAKVGSLERGASEGQIAVARAQAEKARISLEKARLNLSRATLVAPFSGLITQVYSREGELAAGPAIEIIDPASLEVVLDVDEVDLGSVAVGQPAVITLEPWPDQPLNGELTSIAPQATDQGGIVVFEVHVSLPASDLAARPRMTANADVTTTQLHDVLLVPNRAIVADRQAGTYYVMRLQGTNQQRVEVTIGLRDDANTQIISGLEPGDQVSIAQTQQGSSSLQGPPSGMRDLAQ